MRLRPLLLVVLYVAATVLPAAHHLFVGRDLHCGACLAATDDGPALAAACDGSCGDPTHRHQRGHDDRWCPACQAASTVQGHLAAATGPLPASLSALGQPRPVASTPHAADVRLLPARAPPPVASI